MGNYHTAIDYFRKSQTISVSLGDNYALPIAYNGIGLAYKYLSMYDSAIHYYGAMLEHDKTHGSIKDLAIDYQNIGSLYYQWGNFQQAEKYYLDAFKILKDEGSVLEISSITNNLGLVYKSLGMYRKALEYLEQALEMDEKAGITTNIAIRHNNIGEVYSDMGDYAKALERYSKALDINTMTGQKYNMAVNYLNMGTALMKHRKMTRALERYDSGLGIALSIKAGSLVLLFYESMTATLHSMGRYKQALECQSLYSALKDSLFKVEDQAKLADLSIRYELDKKENEIAFLNQQKELEEARSASYRNYIYHLSTGIFVVVVLLVILYGQYRSKIRAYKKLVRKSMETLGNHENTDEPALSGNGTPAGNSENNRSALHKQLHESLTRYLKNDKPYLNKEISIREVAGALGTNTHYLSEAINSYSRKNFNALINDYRVREACRLLADPKNENITIEAISQQSGFHSKSAFNTAFKSYTGVTPSYFRRSVSHT